MSMNHTRLAISLSLLGCLCAMPAAADTPFFFNTGEPDGKIATATRPDTGGAIRDRVGRRLRSHACDVNHQRDLHRPAAGRRDRRRGRRRDLPGVSEGFGCRTNQRAADVLDAASADPRQFAVRCRIRHPRLDQRPDFLDPFGEQQFHRSQLSDTRRHPSQSRPITPAATARSRARRCSST